MSILERHEGCPVDAECFGPTGPYWTFFGTPLEFLWMHALAGAALALVALAVLVSLRKVGKVAMGRRAIGVTVLLAGIGAFLLAAALAPFNPQY